jgi:hypothetical protein
MPNSLIPEPKSPAEEAPLLTPSRPPKFERGDEAYKGHAEHPNGPYEVTAIMYCPHADDWYCCLGKLTGTQVYPQSALLEEDELR